MKRFLLLYIVMLGFITIQVACDITHQWSDDKVAYAKECAIRSYKSRDKDDYRSQRQHMIACGERYDRWVGDHPYFE